MSETATWQPSAPIPNLLKRAAVMAEIRRFFTDRGVLEVETPCMSQATVTDIHLFPFETRFVGPGHSQGLNLYLMTSPEYHMKRLLAAGCGPVFQLCRSFRNEEMGRHHNPEFTMLEWYRPCYDMYRLINEVDDLLQQVLECQPAESLSYQQAFQRHLEIDPLSADKAQLREVAAKLDLSNIADTEEDRDTLLQLLFTMGVGAAHRQRSTNVHLSFPGDSGLFSADQPGRSSGSLSALRSITKVLSWRTVSTS
ncbi:translation elongation factor P Lys34:lysine transferase [Klebsiella pneumoniae subsp. rhinoscleromatis]|nr:translation elongation factor P Lys34:lysine transferase [Klebsiella pneumoniae subsp. rhinoscleromatis]